MTPPRIEKAKQELIIVDLSFTVLARISWLCRMTSSFRMRLLLRSSRELAKSSLK